MEEKLFEMHFAEDDDYQKAVVRFTFFEHPSRIVYYLITLLFVAVLVAFSVYFTVEGNMVTTLYFWILTAVYAAANVFIVVFNYKRALPLMKKRRREICGDGQFVVSDVYVTETGIHIHETPTNWSTTLSLGSIFRVHENKDLVVIRTKAKMALYLARNGFTKGTPEEFVNFLHAKGVK